MLIYLNLHFPKNNTNLYEQLLHRTEESFISIRTFSNKEIETATKNLLQALQSKDWTVSIPFQTMLNYTRFPFVVDTDSTYSIPFRDPHNPYKMETILKNMKNFNKNVKLNTEIFNEYKDMLVNVVSDTQLINLVCTSSPSVQEIIFTQLANAKINISNILSTDKTLVEAQAENFLYILGLCVQSYYNMAKTTQKDGYFEHNINLQESTTQTNRPYAIRMAAWRPFYDISGNYYMFDTGYIRVKIPYSISVTHPGPYTLPILPYFYTLPSNQAVYLPISEINMVKVHKNKREIAPIVEEPNELQTICARYSLGLNLEGKIQSLQLGQVRAGGWVTRKSIHERTQNFRLLSELTSILEPTKMKYKLELKDPPNPKIVFS